ncbi:MAG: sulfite exporter TauE/SafE family protein [Acinetobacter populi]|jgi:uncharacterized membrane protein YfcA|uniref:sulfite exporter TauE/SafE family protein n=1 Tax=Acinetobacter populi TaxID=1582270 RepID=UPI0023552063|nr:sulfite exporter TauE/SafE family protein [Acinetobacter populi]MCH4248544.1 sulfite exporter TauE/SafE family protein [Acinetobacter populi]
MWTLILEGLSIDGLLGLTGAGGGILAVPALMASQGWTVAQAAPVGLLAVTLSALVGTFEGLSKHIVRYRAALWIALISIPSARYGVYLGGVISPIWLTLAFSLVMLFVAYRIFFKKVNDHHTSALCKVNQTTGRLIWNVKTALSLGGIGIVAGLLTGLLGVGGGFMIVPTLSKFTDLDMRSIVATSLMIIFLIGGVSISAHILDGFQYPVSVTLTFVLACMLGMLIGRSLMPLVKDSQIQKIFAITVVGVAFYLIFTVTMT